MEFLGKLGIDWQLLIAQIINFGLLVLILAKFLYRPIVNKIEKEEKELKKAKNKLRQLQEKKESLSEKSEKMTKKAKEESRNTIEEAEQVAENIKQKAKKEAEEQKEEILKQAKEEAKQISSQAETNKYSQLQDKIVDKTLQRLNETMTKDAAEALRSKYLKYLLEQLSEITKDDLGKQDMPLLLESAHELKQEEISKIKQALKNLLEEDIELKTKRNEKLICGFKLQVKGVLIETDLAKEIKDTVNSLDI